MLLVLAASFPVLFAFGADRRHRDGIDGSMGVTLLGIVWIGIPLVHAVLLRDLPNHGAALLVDVLVGTFAADTGAYATGRMFGTHKIAPNLSPNKTLEGLIGGFLIGTMAFWFAGLYQDWLSGVDALIIGAAVAAIAPVGDLFESMLKRDLGKKDTGTLFGPHGGILDRLDAVFFTVVVGYYLAVAARLLTSMRRLAGAATYTPSDEEAGRSSAAPARSGRRRWRSSPPPTSCRSSASPPARAGSWRSSRRAARRAGVALADADAAERARAAWDGRVLAGEEGIRELIASSGADLVLNGIVGAAGLGPTIVALTEGIDVALANKESLVIGGELTMALAEATGARLLPVDSEHSALFQLIGSEPPGHGRAARPHRLRRPLPRPHRPRRGLASRTRSPTRPGGWAAGSRSTRRR